MKQSLSKNHWLHAILFMCFSELDLAGLGKAGAAYSQFNVSCFTRVTWASWLVLEHGGDCPACSVGVPSCS